MWLYYINTAMFCANMFDKYKYKRDNTVKIIRGIPTGMKHVYFAFSQYRIELKL